MPEPIRIVVIVNCGEATVYTPHGCEVFIQDVDADPELKVPEGGFADVMQYGLMHSGDGVFFAGEGDEN